MALAETLSIDKLQQLYEDDWHNLYKPISLSDTNLLGGNATEQLANDSQMQSRVNDIYDRQAEIEDLFGDLQRFPEQMAQMVNTFNSMVTTVDEIRSSQDEIRSFLDDILDFENQSGNRIN